MTQIVSIYRHGSSCVHACDARVKILLLAAYSVALFFIDTWFGLAMMLAILAAVFVVSGVGLRAIRPALTATAVFMVLAIVFNGFSFNLSNIAHQACESGVSASSFGGELPSISLIGSFGISASGLVRGCFIALRILALVVASLIVSLTTTSRELTEAFSDFFGPLRRFRVPVGDIAAVLSIALRFIPVVLEEFMRVRDAMWSRGASFDSGSVLARLRTWGSVFVPVFVGLFRRADALSEAMDARCYGISGIQRTTLRERSFSWKSAAVTAAGVVVFAAIAALL